MDMGRRQSAIVAKAAGFWLLALASAWGQLSHVAVERDSADPGEFYDVDLQTVLSRPRVGDLSADFAVSVDQVTPLGRATLRWLNESQFIVKSAEGRTARLTVSNAKVLDKGGFLHYEIKSELRQRQETTLRFEVATQYNGSDEFPAPLSGLKTWYDGRDYAIEWDSGDTAVVEVTEASGERREAARGPSPLLIPGESSLDLVVTRLLPDGGRAIPVARRVFPERGLRMETATGIRSPVRFALKFRPGENLSLQGVQSLLVCHIPGGAASFFEMGDFGPILWEQGGDMIAGETYAVKFADGRVAKTIFDPRSPMYYSQGMSRVRINGVERVSRTLNESTRGIMPDPSHWIYLPDGSHALPDAPQNLTWDGKEIRWDPLPGATRYVVWVLNSDFTLESHETDAASMSLSLSRDGTWVAVSAILADSRQSRAKAIQVRSDPEGWTSGSAELKVGDRFSFSLGKTLDAAAEAAEEDFTLQGILPLRLNSPRTLIPSSDVFGRPPPTADIFLALSQNARSSNGVGSCFLSVTKDGRFVQWQLERHRDKALIKYMILEVKAEDRAQVLRGVYPAPSAREVADAEAALARLEDPNNTSEDRDAAVATLRERASAVVHRLDQLLEKASPEAASRLHGIISELWGQIDAPLDKPRR